jgi:hypothetical protein
MRQINCSHQWMLVVLFVVLQGCGGGESAYPVKGVVKYPDGTPLTAGMIVFDNGQTSTSGEIHENGSFELPDGAVPGTYTIFFGGKAAGEDYQKPLVAREFTSPASSTLQREVKPEENMFDDLAVEKPR